MPHFSRGVTLAVGLNSIKKSVNCDPCHGNQPLWMASRFLLHRILVSLESSHMAFSSIERDLQIITSL